MFTGTLIEDLFATVERVEAKQNEFHEMADLIIAEAWLASAQEHLHHESHFVGAA